MFKRAYIPVCVGIGVLALVPGARPVGATPVLQVAGAAAAPIDRVRYHRHHIHSARRGAARQPDPEGYEQPPTGGGTYGGPATAFPVGEQALTGPGGRYAVTAPFDSPERIIQKNEQEEFCRDNPEHC